MSLLRAEGKMPRIIREAMLAGMKQNVWCITHGVLYMLGGVRIKEGEIELTGDGGEADNTPWVGRDGYWTLTEE